MNDNELIAEFMGGWNKDSHTRKYGINLPHMDNQWWDIDELKYDTSWDWLMPVVEKINNLNMLDYNIDRDSQWLHEKVVTTRVNCELKFLYKAVVEFIKWYNALKK